MHYNANSGGRPPLGRKVKRVSDVNSMGYNPYEQPSAAPNLYSNISQDNINNAPYQQPPQGYTSTPQVPPQSYGFTPHASATQPNVQQFTPNVFGQPVVQDMAFQYGQQLANTGKAMFKNEVEKYMPVTSLKYYFAVDTKYVVSKLGLLFFPFTHSDWSIKYEHDGPVQPRLEINAPDLYIPMMAYVTYVLVAGLLLGTQQRFSPEQIGILASSALAWCLIELAIYWLTLYIANIKTTLRVLDLLAFSGYKFVGIILSILLSLFGSKTPYYSCLIYFNFALAFFLIRTLKAQVLVETNTEVTYYGDVALPNSGNKRRLYFLLFVAIIQPVLSWWLSYHLIETSIYDKNK